MSQFQDMLSFVEAAWPARAYVVPCLIGPPGIGKTAAVREFASRLSDSDSLDHKVTVINAQRCIPSEVISMTMPDEDNRTMVLYNSSTLTSLSDGDILFLDELWEAHPNVLSVLLTLIESRIMADGTPLPDIMIVAATNKTVPPGQLPLNIRQRFLSMEFSVDKHGTREYIMNTFGVDLCNDVINLITPLGDNYNVLTPRSLTKMVRWLVDTPEDRRHNVANQINRVWSNTLGNILLADIEKSFKKTKEQQVRDVLIDIVGAVYCRYDSEPGVVTRVDFENDPMDKIFTFLQTLPNWDAIKEKLMNVELEDYEEVEEDIKF